MRLFTIGYEKRDIEDFLKTLKDNNIEILIDIRAVPYSRNKDYTKKNLEKRLLEVGIEYLPAKELGSPEDLRKKVKSDRDYGYFFDKYKEFLEGKKEYLGELIDIARKKIICLLCYEGDFNRCHRSSVARQIAETGDLEILHL
ncbi:MAG: DUF488 domain-containing protein [Candidatus Zixiibacteriota bacterium]|nr:MAG: DUF488 domain-containing protein [candidate division Zixibacteria bacterium]